MLDRPEKKYDLKQEVYVAEIEKRVDEIRAICEREKIPFVMVFQTKLEPHDQVPTALVPVLTATARLFKGRTGEAMQAVAFVATHPDFAQGLAQSFDQVSGELEK